MRASTGVRQQQLAQAQARPAAAGQLFVERGKTGVQGRRVQAAQLVRAPQRGVQGFRGGRQGSNGGIHGRGVHFMTVRS
jgi:hypothetical protein